MEKKVLFIDDEDDFLNIMGKRMHSWGYEVCKAANTEEAIEGLNRGDVGVIVLDYIMPDTDGITLLKKIRARSQLKGVPVIMFTAYPDDEAMRSAELLDIAAFIPKVSSYVDTTKILHTTLDLIFKRPQQQNSDFA